MGIHGKDREYSRDRANIGNPKVNRHCPPLTASRISADRAENTLGPSIQYIALRVYHTGDIYAICWGTDQRKKIKAPPHWSLRGESKGLVTRKMFHLMTSSCTSFHGCVSSYSVGCFISIPGKARFVFISTMHSMTCAINNINNN